MEHQRFAVYKVARSLCFLHRYARDKFSHRLDGTRVITECFVTMVILYH